MRPGMTLNSGVRSLAGPSVCCGQGMKFTISLIAIHQIRKLKKTLFRLPNSSGKSCSHDGVGLMYLSCPRVQIRTAALASFAAHPHTLEATACVLALPPSSLSLPLPPSPSPSPPSPHLRDFAEGAPICHSLCAELREIKHRIKMS